MDSRLKIIELFEEIRVAQRDLRISKDINAEEFIYSNRLRIDECVSKLNRLIDKLESFDCLFDIDCNTLLHLCASNSNIVILDNVLQKKGLDYNKKNAQGETALHIATIVNQDLDNLPVIIKILSINEIDIKIKNSTGLTVLDYAIYARDEPLIKLYIKHPSVTDEFFYQSCLRAIMFHHEEALEFMLGEQAKTNSSIFDSHKKIKKISLEAIKHGYINIAMKLYELIPNAISSDKYILKLVTHENRFKIQEHTSNLNALKMSNPPILEIDQAKLFFASKYQKNNHRKRIAILEQDDDLPNSHEYKSFLRRLKSILLRNKNFSTRVQFIVTSKHWIAGDLKIDKGKISVLFIDSLGGAYNDSWLDSILMNCIRRFHHVFPDAEIFSNIERLQRKDLTSCTLFAIDNAAHLFNEDHFLKKAGFNGDLFDYMRQHTIGNKNVVIKNEVICSYKVTTLPLRMIRSMQSLNSNTIQPELFQSLSKCGIFSRIANAEQWESEAPVNKRNETMIQSLNHGLDEFDGKQINIRIKNKLDSTRLAIINYMSSVSSDKINEHLQKFSVNGITKTLKHDSRKQMKRD